MQRLSLARLHAALPPPPVACHQCLLRLAALSLLLREHASLAAQAPLLAALAAFRGALEQAPPAAWPQAAAAFQQAALHCVTAQAPASAGAAAPVPGAVLDALLTTSVSLALLCESGSSSSSSSSAGAAPPRGLQPSLPLADLLPPAIAAVRAACVEKWGCAPPFELRGAAAARGAPPLPCIAVPALVAHSVTELLKNAAVSTMERYGVMGLDDAPPVTLHSAPAEPSALVLTVQDSGVGLPRAAAGGGKGGASYPYFSSAWRGGQGQGQEQVGADWRYSRNFGSALFGKGVGLARASLHARVHGGSLRLVHGGGEAAAAGSGSGGGSGGGGGASAVLTLSCSGEAHFCPHPELLRAATAAQLQ
jgi:hypothetical protein